MNQALVEPIDPMAITGLIGSALWILGWGILILRPSKRPPVVVAPLLV